MKISTHTHPRYVVWLKYFIFGSLIVFLLSLIYIDFVKYPHSSSDASRVLEILFLMLLWSTAMLINTYFYCQNITVTHDGLLIEFLWKDLFVPWGKIMDIKPAYGFLGNSRNTKIYIVLTDALTPFHRCFGLLYSFSVKPAFMIYWTISEYESLVETIKQHAKKS